MILLIHVIVTRVRLAGPGGLRSVVAESAMVRHQLLILHRGRKRGPNLRASDRITAGLLILFLSPARILRSVIVLKPSTVLPLHNLLRKRKYRLLFSSQCGRRPGPKGPNQELIDAVVAMKRRNPSGAALALPSRSPWLSVWRSIRMWCAASGALTTGRRRTQQVHPG